MQEIKIKQVGTWRKRPVKILERVQCGNVYLYRTDEEPDELLPLNHQQVYDYERIRNRLVVGYRIYRRAQFGRKTIQFLMDQQGNQCLYCFRDLGREVYHIDHIRPISFGGTNSVSNLAISCPKCNQRKSGLLFPDLHSIREFIANGWC